MHALLRTIIFLNLAVTAAAGVTSCNDTKPENRLKLYRHELGEFRKEFGGSRHIPDVDFFIFGMGNRTKVIYREGILRNAVTGDTLKKWHIDSELIIPPDYTVIMKTVSGRSIRVYEDEEAVWIREGNRTYPLTGTQKKVNLPDFQEYRYPEIMKVLHQEILINIIDGKPVPNFFVYSNPWRRDGAMMAMCLQVTGNTDQIRQWALSLEDPYDHNNGGETEADNLGQTLFLLSLFTDKNHPLVKKIMEEAEKYEIRCTEGKYIKGKSDFHEVPVYQTKWLKYGLKTMHMKDDYIIPDIQDDYSALFWWDYRDHYKPGTKDACDKVNWPYLGWACDNFHGTKTSPVSDKDYPLTWESEASQADYEGMNIIDKKYSESKISVPHTWHASEVFLYLLKFKKED
jgi:hypothetical protein